MISLLGQKITTWYYNHKNAPLEDGSTLVPVGVVWNTRRVVQYVFRETINEKMQDTGLKHTDRDWLQKYQWAINKVISTLDDVKKYADMAKLWNETEPPVELQRK